MRCVWLFVLGLIFFSTTVYASVDVNNFTIKDFYSADETLSGEINLTIINEDYDVTLSSGEGESINIGDFFYTNGGDYSCSPVDCSVNYEYSSSQADKSFTVGPNKSYGGFVLTGEDIRLQNMYFDISSDFDLSTVNPLTINYFNGNPWSFSEFSDSFSPKSWGCYDLEVPIQGPLVGTSSYCEMISFSKTGSVWVGAYVDSGDNKILNMDIYPEDGGISLGTCTFNPNAVDGCRIDAEAGDVFEAGDYQVCVSSPELTNYRIYQESEDPVCGFVHSNGPESSIKDYAIFRQTAMYSDASYFDSEDVDFEQSVASADHVIEERYGRDCSVGCVLPMFFYGIPQILRISNLSLVYTRSGESDVDNKIYDLNAVPATLNFSGVIDLSLTGFNVSKTGNFTLYLGDKKILDTRVEKVKAPIIKSLSPLNPPAGVPVNFYVDLDYNVSNASLKYTWKFGNKSSVVTTEPSIVYTLSDIGNYTISVEVSAGVNLSSRKSFEVTTISPEEAVNATLDQKREELNGVIKEINKVPSWYQAALSKVINLSYYDDELTRLEKSRLSAGDVSEYISIAKDLYELDTPVGIFSDEGNFPFLMTRLEEVDPNVILGIAGGSTGGSLDDYRGPILNWQVNNVDITYSSLVYFVAKWQGDIIPVFRTYNFNVNVSDDEESYFVIDKPFSEVYFNNLAGARDVEDSTVIIFDPNGGKSFEFYFEDSLETSFFMSPKLSSIVLEANVDTTCNFNLVCERDLGENSRTCRSDCKPVFGAVVYIILSIIFVLILYTILQVWYKRRYEGYLFKDSNQLYNLLMYVTNARARGQNDGVITATLRKKGWSGERINYVIRKSRGKRTGLPEIIPIEKWAAYRRNRAAKRRIVTGAQQQFGRNINKSNFQGRV